MFIMHGYDTDFRIIDNEELIAKTLKSAKAEVEKKRIQAYIILIIGNNGVRSSKEKDGEWIDFFLNLIEPIDC